MQKKTVKLNDGTEVIGDYFEKEDYLVIKQIFSDIIATNKKLKALGGRGLNMPDVFSEALFCLAFDAIRTNNTAHSYDCVMLNSGKGVQVKSASIPNDCTSFGPKSTWDLLYFADFVPNGDISKGDVWFYKIEDDWVYSLVLNSRKNETFKDQQEQGRRPRFSMQNAIIRPNKLQPEKKINIITGVGILDS